jgi:hypothetical protein
MYVNDIEDKSASMTIMTNLLEEMNGKLPQCTRQIYVSALNDKLLAVQNGPKSSQ